MMSAQNHRKALQLRRMIRFSLRTLVVAITILGIWLGLHMRSVNRQKASIEAVKKYGGWVYYDYEVDEDGQVDAKARSSVPAWLLTRFGHDHFHNIAMVSMVYAYENGKRLENRQQSDEMLKHLTGFPRLEVLLLYEGQVTDEGLRHVGRLKSLKRLFMWDGRNVTDQGVAHLASLRSLEYVHLSRSQIGNGSLEIFGRLPELEGLSLQGNRFTDDGLRHLQEMRQLRSLWIGSGKNHITDAGLVHLANLTNLEELELSQTKVTNQGLQHLAELENLKKLFLSNTQVTDAGWLEARLLNCSIDLGTSR